VKAFQFFLPLLRKVEQKKQFGLISVSNLDVFAPLFLKVEEKIEFIIFM